MVDLVGSLVYIETYRTTLLYSFIIIHSYILLFSGFLTYFASAIRRVVVILHPPGLSIPQFQQLGLAYLVDNYFKAYLLNRPRPIFIKHGLQVMRKC